MLLKISAHNAFTTYLAKLSSTLMQRNMSPKSDRRNFLKKSISAGVASIGVPYLIPSNVLARPGKRVGANDKVILGAIGTGSRFGGLSPGNVGGLGSSFASLEGVDFAATADADMGRSQSSATNLGSNV